jgi:hypothetical protein
MGFDTKVAFENDFNNMFDEIWLSRMLYNFWDTYIAWNGDDIQPKMIFEFSFKDSDRSKTVEYLASNRTLSVNELNDLKLIGEQHVVTEVCGSTIYFRPVWLDVNAWSHTLTLTKSKKNYVIGRRRRKLRSGAAIRIKPIR